MQHSTKQEKADPSYEPVFWFVAMCGYVVYAAQQLFASAGQIPAVELYINLAVELHKCISGQFFSYGSLLRLGRDQPLREKGGTTSSSSSSSSSRSSSSDGGMAAEAADLKQESALVKSLGETLRPQSSMADSAGGFDHGSAASLLIFLLAACSTR